MIKDAEWILVAAEVLKLAKEIRDDKLNIALRVNPEMSVDTWYIENPPTKFVQTAYEQLAEVSVKLNGALKKAAMNARTPDDSSPTAA